MSVSTSEKQAAVGQRRARLAPETLRLYGLDWRRFASYCAAHGVACLPAAGEVVADFLQVNGVGRAARGRRLAAIDQRHRALGLPAPGEQAAVRNALREARRGLPKRIRKPAPGPAALIQAARRCPGDQAGRRDRSVLLLLAAGLGRRALVGIQAEQVRFTERGFTVRSGTGEFSVARGEAAACPVQALEEWLRVSDTRYGPVFRKITRWGTLETRALGDDAVRVVLARRVAG